MSLPSLASSRQVRFFAFTSFYVAQGLPIGLISIAVPAWLAAAGASAADIAGFIAVSSLPWAFKLVAGPFMDRFSFLPMGRRRPWVIGAQSGLFFALIVLAFVEDPQSNIPMLTAAAFLVNCFTAVQDVAVDGMAIDILPVDERGRANAFMAFGQVAGYSASGAVSATLLNIWGLTGAALILLAGIFLILLIALLLRERDGEKLMPWTDGSASDRGEEMKVEFKAMAVNIGRVMVMPASLALIMLVLFYRASDGIFASAVPVIAVQQLGYKSTDYSEWVSIVSMTAAILGLLVGPFIDRMGSRRVFAIALPLAGVGYIVAGLCVDYWSIWYVPLVILFGTQIMIHMAFICVIAIHMNICWQRISATQFAIYMAWANLSRSIGAYFYGTISESLVPGMEFILMGALCIVGAVFLIWVDLDKHQERLAELA